jgi:hypothetical protein
MAVSGLKVESTKPFLLSPGDEVSQREISGWVARWGIIAGLLWRATSRAAPVGVF